MYRKVFLCLSLFYISSLRAAFSYGYAINCCCAQSYLLASYCSSCSEIGYSDINIPYFRLCTHLPANHSLVWWGRHALTQWVGHSLTETHSVACLLSPVYTHVLFVCSKNASFFLSVLVAANSANISLCLQGSRVVSRKVRFIVVQDVLWLWPF